MARLKEALVRFLYRTLVPVLVWSLYRAIALTWSVRLIEPDSLLELRAKRIPFILAHWHGDEIVLLSLIARYQIATISSNSIDGDMMTQLIHFLGGKTSRGSSTRGGVGALKGLIRLVRQGHNCSFAVDGPRGPIYEVKPGVFELSRTLNCAIFAAGVTCDKAWHFPRSWNKTYFPKPFAKITIHWDGPLSAVSRDDDPRSEKLASALKDALQRSKVLSQKKNFAATS